MQKAFFTFEIPEDICLRHFKNVWWWYCYRLWYL